MRTRPFLAIILCLTIFSLAPLCLVSEGYPASTKLYYFSAENCPHCKEFGPRIHKTVNQLEGIELVEKDIWEDKDAFEEMLALLETHGDLPVSTPTIFLGNQVWVGIDEQRLADITEKLHNCLQENCPDAMNRLGRATVAPGQSESEEATVNLPLLGDRDAREVSLPIVTLVLGLLDSINPCAFFVLLFLLSLMIHAHSRARMLTVGMVFVSFSGIIYFLFMAAWLNLFLAMGGIRIVTLLAGLVALVIGGMNIKDYFFFHKGPSLSIPDKVKPGLYHRVRDLVKSSSYLSLLGGTALLAIAANSYELLCTAGFPMVFTRILTLQDLPLWQYYTYLAAYNLVYITPLLIIVIIFAITLGAHQLSEKQGRFLKLIAGVMMADMGIVLLFYPALLQSMAGTITVFGLAVLCVLLIITVDWIKNSERKSGP